MKSLVLASFLCAATTMANAQTLEICLVTVDTTISHNIVVWDKPTSGVDSIRIYREDIPGTDILIATWPNDSLSEYHDLTADPNLRPYRYKIAPVDGSGNEGVKSTPHQTIHASAVDNGGVPEVMWTEYVGYPVSSYQCWRDSTSLLGGNDWDLMFTSSPNDTDWNDNTPPLFSLNYTSYKIDVLWSNSCTATRAVNHNTTRSNKTSQINPASIQQATISDLGIYPNPGNGLFRLQFSSTGWLPVHIEVIDASGRTVHRVGTVRVIGQYRTELDLSHLENGLYFVRVTNGASNSALRVVKV